MLSSNELIWVRSGGDSHWLISFGRKKRRQKEKEGTKRAGRCPPHCHSRISAGENWLVFMSKPTKDHSREQRATQWVRLVLGLNRFTAELQSPLSTIAPQCYNNAHRLKKGAATFLENSSQVWVDVPSALRWTDRLSRLSCSPGKRLQRPRTLI